MSKYTWYKRLPEHCRPNTFSLGDLEHFRISSGISDDNFIQMLEATPWYLKNTLRKELHELVQEQKYISTTELWKQAIKNRIEKRYNSKEENPYLKKFTHEEYSKMMKDIEVTNIHFDDFEQVLNFVAIVFKDIRLNEHSGKIMQLNNML